MDAYLLQVAWVLFTVALPALLLGLLWGRRVGIRTGRRRASSLCSCGHARGFHAMGTGKCCASRTTGRDGCQVYDGPAPLPSLNDILGGSS